MPTRATDLSIVVVTWNSADEIASLEAPYVPHEVVGFV